MSPAPNHEDAESEARKIEETGDRLREEQMFLDTLTDLRERIGKGTSYDLIKGAGLVRLLLLDGTSLVDRVNRRYRLKIIFETLDFTIRPPELRQFRVMMRWQNLDVSAQPAARRIRVNRQQLLAAEILQHEDLMFSVDEVVKAAAHMKGGVHYGDPKSARDKKLLEFDRLWSVNETPASTGALRGLLSVIVQWLQELEHAVLQFRSPEREGRETEPPST